MSNVRSVKVEWRGGMRFEGGEEGGPKTLIDADSKLSPGPMVTLLVAAAACSGADVVSILEKMQVQLATFDTEVVGVRAPDHPRRYVSIDFKFTLGGAGLDEIKARRAIDLSLTKYCSVIQSLNPDIPIRYELALVP